MGTPALKLKTISVEVPENTETLGIKNSYYQELIAATLYHNGTLSLKQARLMLGSSRREFEEDVLAKFGYTTMDGNDTNTMTELNASQR